MTAREHLEAWLARYFPTASAEERSREAAEHTLSVAEAALAVGNPDAAAAAIRALREWRGAA